MKRVFSVSQAPCIKINNFKKSAVPDFFTVQLYHLFLQCIKLMWGIFFHRFGIAANAEPCEPENTPSRRNGRLNHPSLRVKFQPPYKTKNGHFNQGEAPLF